ncbi:Arginine decarboxylase [Forsythia ovata]|uniref:Arginine decarboxylase n=1 Tax=Forsythia ovata TaxID=205694 RepID=A0ABD1P2T4_9LAMI
MQGETLTYNSVKLQTLKRTKITYSNLCFNPRAFHNQGKPTGLRLKETNKESTVNLKSQVAKESGLPPLIKALRASAELNDTGFHFPGHKRGQAAPSQLSELIGIEPFHHDVTELPELDRFFAPVGPLLEAKRQAAELLGAKETWFLVGGTSCGIQASILATCSPGDTIILPRNAHVSATAGVIFSGAVPKYIIPENNCDWDIAAGITPSQVKTAMEELYLEGRKVAAVFVTSPTYNGICSKLSEISHLCHSYGIPLIVDEAHGAHFKFHSAMPNTALEQGADIAIQSTHKVLTSLTQSSMLHISGEIIDGERLHKCLHTLQTTSPNWLLLASLDAARHQLSKNPTNIFNKAVELAAEAKTLINKIPGISVLDPPIFFPNFPTMDPLRITIGVWQLGLSGFEINNILYKSHGIVPELIGTRSITLVFSLGTKRNHVQRLVAGLKHLSDSLLPLQSKRDKIFTQFAPFDNNFQMGFTPREAFFASKMTLKIEDGVGKICGEFICPYPPGIPVLVPGEIITERVLNYLVQFINQGGIISGAADPILSTIVVCKT